MQLYTHKSYAETLQSLLGNDVNGQPFHKDHLLTEAFYNNIANAKQLIRGGDLKRKATRPDPDVADPPAPKRRRPAAAAPAPPPLTTKTTSNPTLGTLDVRAPQSAITKSVVKNQTLLADGTLQIQRITIGKYQQFFIFRGH